MKFIKANLSPLKKLFSIEPKGEGGLPYRLGYNDRNGYRLSIKSSISNPFDKNICLSARMTFAKTDKGKNPLGLVFQIRDIDEFSGDYQLKKWADCFRKNKKMPLF
ncbi:MAG: hypothetical protein F6K54_32615 [Okeania sp. SIO3B5]|uniref:hypothetical protein n=1 Tax=Okeania sp. SIO3B5 TaxID=2607811 RepID=UPI0014001A64|nr:hypothetical protein [Okeania sp. SIO3B5]NEO57405.1 hypothetical protein [Okeania sp. SIO3B5]